MLFVHSKKDNLLSDSPVDINIAVLFPREIVVGNGRRDHGGRDD